MTQGNVLDLLQMSIWMVIVGGGPVVLAAMLVGVVIALLQALTQIQEMTLTFVPKLIVVFLVLTATASFVGAQFYVFTERVYAQISRRSDP
jgi:flagellar biosynthetic protein FliQ